ncbi:MAG: CRISPR-associated protein Cas4 [Theionarchaea archaeon]|nr:CRISPR-associated protein Cas4 [Theionarchaea archaeon]
MIQITDLVKLRLCPYRFYLEKMKKKKAPTTQEMYLGKVYHKIAEETVKRENQIFEELEPGCTSRKVFDVLYAEYCRVIRNVILRRKQKLTSLNIDYETLMEELRDYYKEVAIEKVFSIKKAFEKKEEDVIIGHVEYYIENSELGLLGRVDRIEIHGEVLLPVEIKTVEKKRPTSSELLQLAGYALLLERERGTTVSKGIVEYPSKRILVDIPDKLKEYILKLRDYALEILNGEIPKKVRTDKCDRCHFYDMCWGA